MRSRRRRYLLAAGVAVVLVAAIVVGGCTDSGENEVTAPPGELIPGQGPENESRVVSDKVWQATLALHVDIDPSAQADQPADLAPLDGKIILVDTGHGRLVELTADGKSSRVLDEQVDPKLVLSAPMAAASVRGSSTWLIPAPDRYWS